MKLYRGNANWLYHQLNLKYIELHGTEKGLMTFGEFQKKINANIEIIFCGCSFKRSDNPLIATLKTFSDS